jgi:hypothetical protein
VEGGRVGGREPTKVRQALVGAVRSGKPRTREHNRPVVHKSEKKGQVERRDEEFESKRV